MHEDLLEARELRYTHLMNLTETYKKPMIVLKANTMGEDKNTPESVLLVHFFYTMLNKRSIYAEVFPSADGPYAVIVVDQDSHALKKQMIDIEDTHPLGRLIDLDVFHQTEQLSRQSLNLPLRTCIICDQKAVICMKLNRHAYPDLITHFNERVKSYVVNDLLGIATKAMQREIDLDPKFGLVTPFTQGSHPDMTYDMMVTSQRVLLPYFEEIIKIGYDLDDLNEIFKEAKAVGIEAEKAMFAASNGVNTYKGLVFILGLIVASAAHVIKKQAPFHAIFEGIQTMTKGILDHVPTQGTTFGEKAFIEQQFGGVRLEAVQGLPTLQVLLSNPEDLSDHEALVKLIVLSEDSVMLKRAKTLERYYTIKEMFEKLNPHDFVDLQRVTMLMIVQNMSFGGSADLLTGYITLKMLKMSHYFNVKC